jgi:hypothetical protein
VELFRDSAPLGPLGEQSLRGDVVVGQGP